jgi:hypothetical protein
MLRIPAWAVSRGLIKSFAGNVRATTKSARASSVMNAERTKLVHVESVHQSLLVKRTDGYYWSTGV